LSTLGSVILEGLASAIPASSIAGRLYFTTDTHHTFIDNGTTWDDVTSSGGITNPLTTSGDVFVGGTAGAPTRLGIGTTGQVLSVVSGAPAWAAGGGGGGSSPYTAPPTTGWTINGGVVGAGVTFDTSSGASILMFAPKAATIRPYYRSVSSPCTVTAAMSFAGGSGADNVALELGFVSASGQLSSMHLARAIHYHVQNADPTAAFTVVSQINSTLLTTNPVWMQVIDDGTNLIFNYRMDAWCPWITLATEVRSSFLTGGPVAAFWGPYSNNTATNEPCYVNLLSWTVV
jgi:hypothetical protein